MCEGEARDNPKIEMRLPRSARSDNREEIATLEEHSLPDEAGDGAAMTI
jgi:hypothetical protein